MLQQSCFSQGHFGGSEMHAFTYIYIYCVFEASKLVSTKTLLLEHYYRRQGIPSRPELLQKMQSGDGNFRKFPENLPEISGNFRKLLGPPPGRQQLPAISGNLPEISGNLRKFPEIAETVSSNPGLKKCLDKRNALAQFIRS